MGLSLLSVLALGGFGLVGSWVGFLCPLPKCVRERERLLSVQVSLLLSVVEGSEQQSKAMANWL